MIPDQRLTKNKYGAMISYVNMVVSIIIGLVVTPVLIKKLGDSEYGVYVLIASFTSYLSVIQSGFSDTTIRYATRFRAKADIDGAARFNGLSLIINLLITVIVVILGIVLVLKLPELYRSSLTQDEIATAVRLLKLMIVNISITFLANVFFGYLSAYEEFVLLRGLDLLQLVVSNSLFLVVLYMGGKSFEIVLITTVCNLVVCLTQAIYCRNKLKIRFDFSIGKIEKSFLKEVTVYFIAVFIVVIVEQIYWKLDNILIAAFASASAVAVYSIGMSFHKYFMKFSTTISKVMAPRFFLRIDAGANKDAVTNMLIRVSRIQAIPIILALTGLITYGREFIWLWVGKSYDVAYFVALVTLIPYSFELVGNLRNTILQAKGLYMKRSALLFCTSLINIVLTIWWLKIFGIIGAAAATGLGVMIGYVGVTFLLKRDDVIDNRKYLWQTYRSYIIPAVVCMCVGFVLKHFIIPDGWGKWIINAMLYTCTYIALIFAFGINGAERSEIKKLFRR